MVLIFEGLLNTGPVLLVESPYQSRTKNYRRSGSTISESVSSFWARKAGMYSDLGNKRYQ
jgi:hypothetical protein